MLFSDASKSSIWGSVFLELQSPLELLVKNANSWGVHEHFHFWSGFSYMGYSLIICIFNKHFGDSGKSMSLNHTSKNTALRTLSPFPKYNVHIL